MAPKASVDIGKGYCVKCKKMQECEMTLKTAKNGRMMKQGKCPECKTTVTVFVSNKK